MISGNDISTFEGNDDYQSFANFVFAAINIKAQSLIWIRKFIILFCVPLLIGGYTIGIMTQWQNIYNALSLASIGIAMFSVWYTINRRYVTPTAPDVKEKDFMDLTTIKNKLGNANNDWHESE